MPTITIEGVAYEVYDTEVNVDQYLRAAPHADTWRNSLETARRYAMVGASRVFDRQTWTGTKTSGAQPIEFPRDGLTDKDGVALAAGTTPQEVLDGYAEYTLLLLADSEIQGQSGSGKNIKSVKAGSALVTFFSSTITGATAAAKFPPAVHELIKAYLTGTGALGIVATGISEDASFLNKDYGLTAEGLP
jgi:hypothetical protein